MPSPVPTFWERLQNFFSWFARLFCEKERKPDCEEQIGLPTQVVHGKNLSSDATSSTTKVRQGTQGRPPRRPEWARQNVFRQPSSKRKAVYDDRPHKKHRPAPGPPLVQFDSNHQRSKHLTHRLHATPTIRIEDWSDLPPRKSFSQRLSFITAPARALRLSGLFPDPRKDLLAVPATDSSGHLCLSSSSRTGRYRHADSKASEQKDVSTSKLALSLGLCGSATNELRNLDNTQAKAIDNKPRHPHSAEELFTRRLHTTSRNTMPASTTKRVSRRYPFCSLPAPGFSSLLCTNSIAERDPHSSNKLGRTGQGSEATADNPVAEIDPYASIDSISPVMSHQKTGSPITTARVTHNSQSLLGLGAPAKLPYADFGDVPYPFVFDLDVYLSEANVPATPLLLVSFPGFGSEFSSPPTDYFDTPTPSPKLPVAPLLLQQTGLSDTTGIACEIPDSSRTSGDLVPERSIRESLDASRMTLSLYSSGIGDAASSQSEYSDLSVGCVDDSVTSSDFGKPTGDDLDKPTFNDVDNASHESDTSTVIETVPPESEKVTNVYASLDDDGAEMTNQTSASLEYTSSAPTGKSGETSYEGEGESAGKMKINDSLTIPESTFFNRHRRLLENLSFSSNSRQQQSLKKDRPDSSTLLERPNVASPKAYPAVPGVSSNAIAYSRFPRALNNVTVAAGTHLRSVPQEGSVTSQRKMHGRATAPVKPLTLMLIPTLDIGEIMRRGIRASKGGFERGRPRFSRVGQKLGGVGISDAPELPQVARRKVMPEKF